MYMYTDVPDNYDAFEEHEDEKARVQRMRGRLAHSYGDEERKDREDEG